jgi:hypothetical protein
LQAVSTLGKHCSAEGCAKSVDVVLGKFPGFDLEAVVPVPASEALSEIAGDGHHAGFPLLEDMTVLVKHQRRVLEELLRTVAQVDASAAGRGDCTQVQPCEQGVFDDFHLVHVRTEQAGQSCPNVTGQGNAAAEAESHGTAA